MDVITKKVSEAITTKNQIQSDYIIRITKHKRGFVIRTSENLELTDTLFLNSERDIAQDILFNEINQILKTDEDKRKSDTKYVCPKCGEEVMTFKAGKKGEKSYWACPGCQYKIPHYKRS